MTDTILGLTFFVSIFSAGFAAGYAVRESVSRKRRHRSAHWRLSGTAQ